VSRALHNIADEIVKDWPNPFFGAVPYIRAMRHLETMDDKYGEDAAVNVVIYFLSNAKTWRGETARRVKAELKGMLVS
jgi:hypothetical protein